MFLSWVLDIHNFYIYLFLSSRLFCANVNKYCNEFDSVVDHRYFTESSGYNSVYQKN